MSLPSFCGVEIDQSSAESVCHCDRSAPVVSFVLSLFVGRDAPLIALSASPLRAVCAGGGWGTCQRAIETDDAQHNTDRTSDRAAVTEVRSAVDRRGRGGGAGSGEGAVAARDAHAPHSRDARPGLTTTRETSRARARRSSFLSNCHHATGEYTHGQQSAARWENSPLLSYSAGVSLP